ncbi:MAG: hypothetical protein AB7N76_34590 [Planctomycetota bacterium]
MGLAEQMAAVERLMRRPKDLPVVLAKAEPGDAEVLKTIDRARLQATHGAFAEVVVGRWWRPRFPATIAALEEALGADRAASALLGDEAFLEAQEEDLTGRALAKAVLHGIAGGQLEELPLWTSELLAYEYLLAVALPRRAEGEPIDHEVEARLLPDALWLSGGRLARPIVVASFAWPVAELADGQRPDAPDPHTRLLYLDLDGDAVVDLEAPDLAGDVLALLAQGASDEVIAALDPDAKDMLAELRDLRLAR